MVPLISNVKGGWEVGTILLLAMNSLILTVLFLEQEWYCSFARVPGKTVKYGSEGAEYVLRVNKRVNKAEKTVTKHKVKGVFKVESEAVEKVEKPGGKAAVSKGTAEINYVNFNKTHKDSLPKPKGDGPNGGKLQSHHGLQEELQFMVDDLPKAGFSRNTTSQVLEQQYKMLNKLGVKYERIDY